MRWQATSIYMELQTTSIVQIALLFSSSFRKSRMPYQDAHRLQRVSNDTHLKQLCQQHHVALKCSNVCRSVALEVLSTGVSSVPVSVFCPQRKLDADSDPNTLGCSWNCMMPVNEIGKT